MKKVHLMALVVCCGLAAWSSAGDLWIMSGAGNEVFINGQSVGIIESADDGVRVPGLAPGEHTVKTSKDGVMSGDYGFELGYAPTQVVVLGPGAASSAGDEEPVGAIEVTSNPKECDIQLGVRKYTKKQPILLLVGIPVGEHDLRFESEGAGLQSKVTVVTGQSAQVMVDFGNNRVAVVAAPGVSVSTTPEETPQAKLACIEYWVEVLRTDNPEAVKAARSALKDQGFPEYHQQLIVDNENPGSPVFKLRVGPITRKKMARYVFGLLRHGGFKTAWVVPAECDPSLARKVE
jgi:hypothetical protein